MIYKRKFHIISLLIVVFSTFFCNTLYGQRKELDPNLIEKLIESIAQSSEEDLDYTSLMEDLTSFLKEPLNLNKATREDLEKLHILSQVQIQNFLSYREKTGKLLSPYELQLISGFSFETIQNLLPFIRIEEMNQLKLSTHKNKRSKNLLLLRTQRILQTEEGYRNYPLEDFPNPETFEQKQRSRYLGNPWKYYTRYAFQSRNRRFSMGFTAEKDPGEEFFKGKQAKGFDYYSFHLQVMGTRFIRQINLGDYQLKFGEGLCLWSGLSSGKSSLAIQNAKKSQGIKSYRSADENLFFRGAAIHWKLPGNLSLSTFVSRKKIDANLNEPEEEDEETLATSTPSTGFHRNPNELDQYHKLTEMVYGGNFHLNQNHFQAGITYLNYHFSPALVPTEKTYNQFDFSGSKNYNLGANYQFHIHNLFFFGESARSQSGGMAHLHGLQIQAHPQISMELLFRKFDRDYHALYSNAFGEQSKPQNEEGFYLGTELHPLKNWKILAYYDLFKFPWLRYRVNAPSEGHDFFTQIEYHPSNRTNLHVRFKREVKPENTSTEAGITLQDQIQKIQARFHINFQLHSNLEFRNRLEISSYQKGTQKEEGYLIYQDVIYRNQQLPLTLSFRYALFDTDSYNTRIYAYENDILYAYSIPAYYSKGTRTYLTLRIPFSKNWIFYARYAQTHYTDKETIGSGTAEIMGSLKSEIKFQFQFQF